MEMRVYVWLCVFFLCALETQFCFFFAVFLQSSFFLLNDFYNRVSCIRSHANIDSYAANPNLRTLSKITFFF